LQWIYGLSFSKDVGLPLHSEIMTSTALRSWTSFPNISMLREKIFARYKDLQGDGRTKLTGAGMPNHRRKFLS